MINILLVGRVGSMAFSSFFGWDVHLKKKNYYNNKKENSNNYNNICDYYLFWDLIDFGFCGLNCVISNKLNEGVTFYFKFGLGGRGGVWEGTIWVSP